MPALQPTPMMQQYLQIKEEHKDEILFFRIGDFYEMFYEDAKIVSRELELTLTGKDCGLKERAPMCGVPFHAADIYISRLIERGYKVAICEQMEDPAQAKGLVRRDIIRIVTPGTVTDASGLNEKQNNFVCAVNVVGKRAGLAYCDVTTGEFFVRLLAQADGELKSALARVQPREILTNNPTYVSQFVSIHCNPYPQTAFQNNNARDVLLEHFKVGSLSALGLDQSFAPASAAAGALMRYLTETQKISLEHITAIRAENGANAMPLDAGTRRNLELTEGLHSRTVKGSLLWLLDHTATAMGGRMMRAFVEQPLIDKAAIESRLSAVDALYQNSVLSESLYDILMKVYDMERLLGRVAYKSLNARDCLALLRSLKQVPQVLSLLSEISCEAMQNVLSLMDPLPELTDLLERAINPDAPLAITEGDIIREGFNPQLDELRRAATEGKQWLSDLEARERKATGINNLRIQYNRVFGYYIEVTKSNYALVPLRYQRRQTLSNCERFTTDELRELEGKVTGAQEQATRMETELFVNVREQIARFMKPLQQTALGLKTLDALLSFARVARENNYVRPEMTEDGTLDIVEGRHPVVEKTLENQDFVPNDTHMNNDEKRMQIITGPNMAGKSTYMRQVALITFMAHIGSFVPARSARIPLVDSIFTRVGASDDLASGQSTFMVEMSEMAYILRTSTERSLVILDEIGRGTSTFDGLSIAWAAVEFLTDKKKSGAKTLFATHYHELSELEGHLEGVQNYCVSVKEHGEDVIFLRKIIPGGADKSFGVYVARLAGVPKSVVMRAQEIEARLEVNNINQNSIGQNILSDGSKRKNEQVDMTTFHLTEFVEEVRKLDVMAMTPMDALNELFLLREKARKL